MTTPVPVKSPSVPVPGRWQTRVLLRSNEGDGYEIDRQILIDSSAFFKNLFNLPKANESGQNMVASSGTTPALGHASDAIVSPKFEIPEDGLTLDEDINIDTNTKDLHLFADLMQQIVRFKRFVDPYNLNITLEEAVVLLALTDKYDCGDIRMAVRGRLAFLARTAPWEVFHIACDWEDVWLGQRAIARVTEKSIHTFAPLAQDSNIWDRLAPLSHAWQVAFLRLYMPTTQQGYDAHAPTLGLLDSNFATWADDFDPKKA